MADTRERSNKLLDRVLKETVFPEGVAEAVLERYARAYPAEISDNLSWGPCATYLVEVLMENGNWQQALGMLGRGVGDALYVLRACKTNAASDVLVAGVLNAWDLGVEAQLELVRVLKPDSVMVRRLIEEEALGAKARTALLRKLAGSSGSQMPTTLDKLFRATTGYEGPTVVRNPYRGGDQLPDNSGAEGLTEGLTAWYGWGQFRYSNISSVLLRGLGDGSTAESRAAWPMALDMIETHSAGSLGELMETAMLLARSMVLA
jgi:hypothetical protein